MKMFGIVGVFVVGLFVDPLLLMWLVSAVREWCPSVPSMSYGQGFGVTLVLVVSMALGWAVKGFVTTLLD